LSTLGVRGPSLAVSLQRLAEHRIHLGLSFPHECLPLRQDLLIPLPWGYQPEPTAHGRRSGSLPEAAVAAGVLLPGRGTACPPRPAMATDGRFLYVWCQGVGLLKAGLGLGGTTRGKVYTRSPCSVREVPLG
ncbi:unnamed protein product, partial [Discosporangium mesarthrocarpum]